MRVQPRTPPACARRLESFHRPSDILGMDVAICDVGGSWRQVGRADVVGPLPVEELDPSLGIGDPNDLRHRIRHQPEPGLALAQIVFDTRALDGVPDAFGRVLDQPDFRLRPVSRLRLRDRQRAHKLTVLQQRDRNQCRHPHRGQCRAFGRCNPVRGLRVPFHDGLARLLGGSVPRTPIAAARRQPAAPRLGHSLGRCRRCLLRSISP